MSAEAHQAQHVGIGLDDVAIAVIFPVAGQGVVMVARFQGLVGPPGGQEDAKVGVKRRVVQPLFLALVVALELAGVVRRPH